MAKVLLHHWQFVFCCLMRCVIIIGHECKENKGRDNETQAIP
jgi:hypothetical protein